MDIPEKLANEAKEAESSAKEYMESFDEIAELYIERGLTPDSGLRGTASEIEAVIKEDNIDGSLNQLQIDVFTLRQHENDYLASLDIKYQIRLHDAEKEFMTHLEGTDLSQGEKDKINGLLDEYLASFDNIVELDEHIGTNEVFLVGAARHVIEVAVQLQGDAVESIEKS